MASEFQKTWQSVFLKSIPIPLTWHGSELLCVCVSFRIALEAEGELFKSLAEKEPTFAGISHYLSLLVFLSLSKPPARRPWLI